MIEQTEENDNDNIKSISGTEIRDALCKGDLIPETLMRKEIVDYLRDRLDNGKAVFVD